MTNNFPKNIAEYLKENHKLSDEPTNDEIDSVIGDDYEIQGDIYTYLHESSGRRTLDLCDQPGYEDFLSDVAYYAQKGVL